MRAEREDIQFADERRPNYMMLVGAASLVLLAILLYIGLSGPDEAVLAPAPLPVVRDSAIVAPPVVDAPPEQQTPTTTAEGAVPRDFTERQLAPPTSTMGAGAAPVSERAQSERLVIDGQLLEQLEKDAQPEESTD